MENNVRVEFFGDEYENKSFFGKCQQVSVVEYKFIHEYDKRSLVAPLGLKAKVKVAHGEMIINADASSFDALDNNTCSLYFNINNRVYELNVIFENDSIKQVWLEEWLDNNEFEDGLDCDNIYQGKDLIILDAK